MSNYFKFYFLASLKLWVFFKDRWNTLPPITPISNATIQHPWHLRNPLTVSSTNQHVIQPISNETNQRVLRINLKVNKSYKINTCIVLVNLLKKGVIFLKNTKRKFGGFFLNFFSPQKMKKLHGAWHICSLHYWSIVHTIVIKTGLSSKCFRCSILNTTTICLSLSHGCNARLCRFFVFFTLM